MHKNVIKSNMLVIIWGGGKRWNLKSQVTHQSLIFQMKSCMSSIDLVTIVSKIWLNLWDN